MKTEVYLIPVCGLAGCGKGTLIGNLKELARTSSKISIRPVEMGAFYRARAKTDGAIKDTMESGALISNSSVNDDFVQLLNGALASLLLTGEVKEKVIVLLDGYPRTLSQWEYFLNYRIEKNVSVAGIFIEIDEDVVRHRSTIRRLCPHCGKTFSIEEYKVCPICGREGIERQDDGNMEKRIEVFNQYTRPVIEEAKSILDHQITVNGENTQLASQQVWEFLQTL